MNQYFVNKSLPYKEQDSKRVLFLFFLCLPFSALLSHAHLASALWVLLFLCAGCFRGVWQPYEARATLPFCAFLALTAAGAITAPLPTALSALLRLSFFLPGMFAHRRENFCRIFALLGGILGLLALLQVALGRGATGYSDTRLFGALARASFPFGNPNLLAAFLLPTVPLALGAAERTGRRRWLYLACALLSLGGVAATFSRGAILALFIGCFWLYARRLGVFRPLATVLAFSPWARLLLPRSLLFRIGSLGQIDSSASYRLSLWKSVLRLSPRTLLFGVGEGREALLSLLSPVLLAGLSHVEHTHSLFLHILLSEGLFAFLLFLWCAALALVRAPRELAAALLSLLVFGIFDDPLYCGQTEVLFWFLLGLSQKRKSAL